MSFLLAVGRELISRDLLFGAVANLGVFLVGACAFKLKQVKYLQTLKGFLGP